jgi:hypothetical protein
MGCCALLAKHDSLRHNSQTACSRIGSIVSMPRAGGLVICHRDNDLGNMGLEGGDKELKGGRTMITCRPLNVRYWKSRVVGAGTMRKFTTPASFLTPAPMSTLASPRWDRVTVSSFQSSIKYCPLAHHLATAVYYPRQGAQAHLWLQT